MGSRVLGLLLAACLSGGGCADELELPPLLTTQPPLADGLGGLRELSAGTGCPSLDQPGPVTIETAGGPRRVTFLFGAEPAPGRPLLFVFHGLGSTGRSMIPRMGLEELADQGVVVAIPEGVRTAKFGWGAGPKGVHDAILIEDVRRCAYDRLGVDLERVHVTGFSAGGLWSTLMLMHASELFASATIYSGGELPPFVTYTRPKHRVPALVIWGGAADVYRSRGFNVEFDGAARRFSDSLHRDGHFVVRCDHGGGHTLPVTYAPLLHAWTLAHRFGAPAELADWTLDRLPSGCEVMRPDR